MSTTYIAVIVNVLAFVLPHLGITVGNDALTTTVQTVVVIGSGVWVLVQRYLRGDITLFGAYK